MYHDRRSGLSFIKLSVLSLLFSCVLRLSPTNVIFVRKVKLTYE